MKSVADKIRVLVARTAERQSVLPDPGRAKRVFPPPPPEPVPDSGYSQALAGMVHRDFLKSIPYWELNMRANKLEAHPRILEFEKGLIKRMAALGVPMYAHCVWRTPDEQLALWERKRTKARPGESPHNWGCAVDIVHCRYHWDLTERQWAIIGHIGKEYGKASGLNVIWGGDWKFYDPAHWELADWKQCRIPRYAELD